MVHQALQRRGQTCYSFVAKFSSTVNCSRISWLGGHWWLIDYPYILAESTWTSRKVRGCRLSPATWHGRLAAEGLAVAWNYASAFSHSLSLRIHHNAAGNRASSLRTQWCTTNWNLISHIRRWERILIFYF